jgi:hypothetical protein
VHLLEAAKIKIAASNRLISERVIRAHFSNTEAENGISYALLTFDGKTRAMQPLKPAAGSTRQSSRIYGVKK